MLKLFEVTIERTYVIVAESQREADLDASTYERESIGDSDPDSIWVHEIENIKGIPYGWNKCYPYGDGEDRVCEDYFKDPETGEELPPPYEGPRLPFPEN